MRFQYVKIQNFLSFGPAQEIQLANRGLMAVFGDNKDSKGSDSNGAGKSTIPEAIVWVLYGETMRGYKGDDVVNRIVGKDCEVSLRIEESGREYLLSRYRKKSGLKKPNDVRLFLMDGNRVVNDLTGGTNADTEVLIQTLVGMDFTTFTQSVMLSHGSRPFSQMTDREANQVLEDIMRTDTVSRAQAATKTRVVERQSQLATLRTKMQGLEQQASDTELRISKLVTQRDQHASLLENRRLELIQRRVALEIKLDEIYVRTGLDALMVLRDHQTAQLDDATKDLNKIRLEELAAMQDVGSKRTHLAHEEGGYTGRLRQIQNDLTRVNQLVGNPCPSCQQVLTPDAADSCVQGWKGETQEIEKQLKELAKRKAKLETQHKNLVAKVTKGKADAETLVNELRAVLQGTVADVQKRGSDLQAICDLEQQIAALDEEIENLHDAGNPYQGFIDQEANELKQHRAEIRHLSSREHVLDVQLRHLNFLVNAFGNGGLKSFVLDTVVPQLNSAAQTYLDLLSGGDIQIRFATQTQLKSGSVTNKFQVQAINRFGADVYLGNSAGEKKRVDWAVAMALGDLAATRASKQIRFKGLDEPFENLDETGEDSVIRLLHTVVPQYETILVITHSTHLQSQFQNALLVVKQNGVSRMA